MQHRNNIIGALLALLSFGLFSTHDVLVKWLGGDFSPFQIIFFSVLFSFPITTLLVIGKGHHTNLRPVHVGWSALRTVAAVMTGISAFYAFSVLPLAQVYAVVFTTPLIITVLSVPLLGEKVGKHRVFAILIGLVGVLIVLRPGTTELTLGHLAALSCATFGALASVIVRKIGKDEHSVIFLIYPMLANFVIMGALLPFVYEPMAVEHIGGIALMALLASVAGMLMISAYKIGEAVMVAPMHYSQLLWALFYGAFFFSESVDAYTLLGASIVIASGVYILIRESIKGSSSNQPVTRTKTRQETGIYPRMSILDKLRSAKDKLL